jgi:hypothetical protein
VGLGFLGAGRQFHDPDVLPEGRGGPQAAGRRSRPPAARTRGPGTRWSCRWGARCRNGTASSR